MRRTVLGMAAVGLSTFVLLAVFASGALADDPPPSGSGTGASASVATDKSSDQQVAAEVPVGPIEHVRRVEHGSMKLRLSRCEARLHQLRKDDGCLLRDLSGMVGDLVGRRDRDHLGLRPHRRVQAAAKGLGRLGQTEGAAHVPRHDSARRELAQVRERRRHSRRTGR